MNNKLKKLVRVLGAVAIVALTLAISYYPPSVYDVLVLDDYTSDDFTVFTVTISIFGISGFTALVIDMFRE